MCKKNEFKIFSLLSKKFKSLLTDVAGLAFSERKERKVH